MDKPICKKCEKEVNCSIKVKVKCLKKGEKTVRFKSFYAVCDKCNADINILEIQDGNVSILNFK